MDDRELVRAANASSSYLNALATRAVAPTSAAVDQLRELWEPLPSGGAGVEEVQRLLEERIAPATMATAGPRFFGFVTGGCHRAALLANWYAGAWDQNVLLSESSPAGVAIENLTLSWLIELLGLPTDCGGALVTGATMANLTALAAARGALLRGAGWDIEGNGLRESPPIRIVIGEEAHPTIIKALRLLGYGERDLTRIPTDSQGRMRVSSLPRHPGKPLLTILQAGNVNSGAFDPAKEIIAWARDHGSWVHVDGAFGLWGCLVKATRAQVQPFLKADSWGIDAHKWLNVPYDSGFAVVRDPTALHQAFAFDAPYLPNQAQREPLNYTPDTSRRFRALEIWAVLKALGKSGVREQIEKNCRQARKFADQLAAAGHNILNDVVLNQVVVSFGNPAKTMRVVEAIQHDGTCWCGPTVWRGQTAMRISVSSWATEDTDVDSSIAAILAAAKRH